MRNLSWCRHCSWLFFPWLFWALHPWRQKKECGRACGEDECDREAIGAGQGVAVMQRRRHDLQIGFLPPPTTQ